MQLAAAIAADGHQRQIADGFKTVGDPQPLQQLVDKFGARRNELLRGDAGVKRLAQPVLEGIDVRLNCSTVQIALRASSPDVPAGRAEEGRLCQVNELLIASP